VIRSFPYFSPFGGAFPGFFPFYSSALYVPNVVTQTYNVAGVQGLVQTVDSNGYNTPTVSLGVPDYLLQAYGGNITAIQRDLQAGFLKCRSS
jgi:hypothetical protein